MTSVLYTLVQLSWGCIQSTVGLAVFLVCCIRRLLPGGRERLGPLNTRYIDGCWVSEWSLSGGLSLGAFVFVCQGYSPELLAHEMGHTLQSAILGPLYLPIIGIPSLVWAGLPQFGRFRARKKISYYRFYPEAWANRLGKRFKRR